MSKIVLGLFNDRDDAENSIERLRDQGYTPKNISVIMKDPELSKSISSATKVVTATSASGLLEALTSAGLSKAETKVYENLIFEGKIFLAVPAKKDGEGDVEQILSDTDAFLIKSIQSKLATEADDIEEESHFDRPSDFGGPRKHAYVYNQAKGGKSSAKSKSKKTTKKFKKGAH